MKGVRSLSEAAGGLALDADAETGKHESEQRQFRLIIRSNHII